MAKTFGQKINNLSGLILILVLVLATFLRLWQVSLIPPSLFGDELDVGYHAYSILTTGRDYFGQFLPTYIHSLAEWRAPLFIYSAVPFVWIFGLNEIGVRGSAIFFGVVDILLLYLLVKELFGKRGIALLVALFLAISPWHLHYSRAAFEVTLLLALFLGGLLFFLKGLKRPSLLLLASFLFALTPYTYSTANLFLPLLLFSLFLIFKEKILKIEKKWLGLSFLTGLLILSPFIVSLASGQSTHRFSKISIFVQESLIDEINIQRGQEGPMGRFFHNKVTVYGKTFITNYLTAFSPQFLFLSGDPNPRQNVGKTGQFFLVFLPLLLFGIGQGVANFRKPPFPLIFSWLLLSPIPAALTQDGGSHATRLFLMLPPLIILISLGALSLWEMKKQSVRIVLSLAVLGFLILEMIFFFHQYFVHYPKETWRFWQQGFKEPMMEITKRQKDYERILINNTSEPSLLRFLFWTRYNPADFHKNFTGDVAQENILSGFDGFALGKFYFGSFNKEGNLAKVLTPKTLYLVSQKEEVPGDWDWRKDPPAKIKVLVTATNPFGEPLFYLVTGE